MFHAHFAKSKREKAKIGVHDSDPIGKERPDLVWVSILPSKPQRLARMAHPYPRHFPLSFHCLLHSLQYTP